MARIVWLFLLLGMWPLGASADYYWEANGGKFADASSACSAQAAGAWGGVGAKVQAFKMAANGTSAICTVRYPNSTVDSTSTLLRQGTACTPPKTFNVATGACDDPPPPACEAGKTLVTRGSDSPTTTIAGRVTILSTPPSTVCSASCQYQLSSSKATSCYLVSGSTSTGFCNYTMTSDGQNCSADNATPPGVGDDPNPAPPPEEPPSTPDNPDSCPEGMVPSGGGCIPKTPTEEPPPSDGCEFSLDPNCGKDDPSNPDNPGDGTPDGCEFSLDPNCGKTPGDPGDGSGSGSGSGDGGSGDGAGDGSGDGTGNGSSDGGDGSDDGKCDPKTDSKCADQGEGEEGGCDPAKDPSCAGVAGPGKSLEKPTDGTWDEANKEWDDKVAKAKKELKDQVKANAEQMKGLFALGLSSGGGSLPCESFVVWHTSVSLCFSQYSEQLSYFRYALLLMAAVIAAYAVLKD